MYVSMYIMHVCICMYVYIHNCTYVEVCMYVCVYVPMHACMYVCMTLYVCMYVCMYVYMYVNNMYVCLCV